jgi:hypothetical protein
MNPEIGLAGQGFAHVKTVHEIVSFHTISQSWLRRIRLIPKFPYFTADSTVKIWCTIQYSTH